MKEILRIPQALVFMSDFNRPNLHYSVRLKPETQEEQLALLVKLVETHSPPHWYLIYQVGTDFRGQSGIIYTTTVKEVETIAGELRKRGLKVGAYHAQLEPPEARSRWVNCKCDKFVFVFCICICIIVVKPISTKSLVKASRKTQRVV